MAEQTLLLELLFFAYYDKAECDAAQFVALVQLFVRQEFGAKQPYAALFDDAARQVSVVLS